MEKERSFDNGISATPGNPWRGFAHPEHRSEEYEGLLRTLRFASIQLNKFWVEFNALPVFMNEMKGASIRQIEGLFDWFQAAPSWSARVGLPRLVPELCNEASRKVLLEFTSRVVRARMLRAGLAKLVSAPWATEAELGDALKRLQVAEKLTQSLGLTSGGLAETEARIEILGQRLERNVRLQAFFSRLATECGLDAEATHLRESMRMFQAVELIRHTPFSVWQWRKPQCLAAQNRARILAWQERSQPLVEARRRLQPHFRMEERVAAAQLRLLAEKIRDAGFFRALNSGYKESLRKYRELLLLPEGANPPKESRAQISSQLEDWANYLEVKAQVEDSAEAKAIFAPHFRGIDTNFDAALEANAWAAQVRAELESEDKGAEADLCTRLADALFMAPQEALLQAVEACSGAGIQAVQAILAEPEYAAGREFAAIGCDEEACWMEATQLRDHLIALGVHAGTKLSELPAIRAAAGDLLALLVNINAQPEARAAFKHAFAGEHTDLSLLASAQDYIDFVAGAGLSESLRASFLTAHGPQRLHDTRAGVVPALNGLAHVKEHLRRLEAATHGQSRSLEDLPLLDLINRIQRALKSPAQLGALVDELRISH